jgi:hypothetical protein
MPRLVHVKTMFLQKVRFNRFYENDHNLNSVMNFIAILELT